MAAIRAVAVPPEDRHPDGRDHGDGTVAGGQAGIKPQRTWVAESSQEWIAGEVRWVREHAHLLEP